MNARGGLLLALERLFEGPRDSVLTLDSLLAGLETRSYAFAIAVLDLPNCFPTGIPWLSTITGVPMLLLVMQAYLGRPVPSLPRGLGRRGLPRGKLQALLARARRPIEWLESAIHERHSWWLAGLPRRALQVAMALLILLLALPIPFDNLLPALAILFFCLAMIETDGIMAILGWGTAILSVVWTIFLLIVGPLVVIEFIKPLI
jgi:hypothetical protein